MATMKTPGVYIVEKNAFPNSVVEIATAVPAFVGYTQKALNGNKSLLNKAWRITSMAEFRSYFGGPPKPQFNVEEGDNSSTIMFNNKKYAVTRTDKYNMYYNMLLFYANGGGPCYIVSVGNYDKETEIEKAKLEDGITPLLKEQEPTMLVIPEAVALSDANDCYALQQAMVKHCGYEMRNRIALLDIYEGYKDRNNQDGDMVNNFREKIGSDFLDFGAVYYPWINSSIVQENELDYSNMDLIQLTAYITEEIEANYKLIQEREESKAKNEREKEEAIKKIEEKKNEALKILELVNDDETMIKSEIERGKSEGNYESVRKKNHNLLRNLSFFYGEIMKEMRFSLNQLPVSAAMAGVITMVDNTKGVWKAPANVGIATAVSPTQSISHEEQEDLNVPLSGKSVNAIRAFAGEGLKVWGARTLDGNSQDWRYINVRRTMIMLEESVKNAARAYVFDPNEANTWVNVKSMIFNFLNGIWKRGGLAGSSPEDAYSVHVGLGETMTPEDVLEGIMRITVLVAIVRPAEFIEITFQQQMQKS